MNSWNNQLERKIKSLFDQGISDFPTVLRKCDGASPAELTAIYSSVSSQYKPINRLKDNKHVRFYLEIPAANPDYYQWWYTLEAQERILRRIEEETEKDNILCIGTPTIAAKMASEGYNVKLLDIDQDVIDKFNEIYSSHHCLAIKYNVNQELPKDLQCNNDMVIIDPPWYENSFKAFLSRGIELLRKDGLIFCSFPQKLTRPTVIDEKKRIISELIEIGHEIEYIEKGLVEYCVPAFEEAVLNKSNTEIKNSPWRTGDLITIRIKNSNTLGWDIEDDEEIISFANIKNASHFRIFLRLKDLPSSENIKENSQYSKSFSRREEVGPVNLWTCTKRGFVVNNIHAVKIVLTSWKDGNDKNTVENILEASGEVKDAKALLNDLDNKLGLWDITNSMEIKRNYESIVKYNNYTYSKWATKPTKREHGTASDEYRIEFQRDRDRVIWSSSFRKLSNKTQLFPIDDHGFERHRLSHSIEVMQLATTISNSFGLDRDLCEAGAYVHDIGHTPFGHAGEVALNSIITALGVKSGFNHYEHGLDVVRYLEESYLHKPGDSHAGLDLTNEVCECILKHIYVYEGSNRICQKSLYENTKHKDIIKSGYGSLESQAIRISDKLSYLISDIEDGIRLGSITKDDLRTCRLFNRSPINISSANYPTLLTAFIDQRGTLIKLLMEDIIEESAKRISKCGSVDDVGIASDYCISPSSIVKSDMDEIWKLIQKKKLHNDPRVLASNLRASKIVKELFLMFVMYPSYIDNQYAKRHERLKSSKYIKHYIQTKNTFDIKPELLHTFPLDSMIGHSREKEQSIDMYQLILAKDYIASLTDNGIMIEYESIFGNSRPRKRTVG